MQNALTRGKIRGEFCVLGWGKVNLEDLEAGGKKMLLVM